MFSMDWIEWHKFFAEVCFGHCNRIWHISGYLTSRSGLFQPSQVDLNFRITRQKSGHSIKVSRLGSLDVVTETSFTWNGKKFKLCTLESGINAVMPEGEKHWGGAVVIGGDNLPSPSLNRVNWPAKYWGGQWLPWPPPVPAPLSYKQLAICF